MAQMRTPPPKRLSVRYCWWRRRLISPLFFFLGSFPTITLAPNFFQVPPYYSHFMRHREDFRKQPKSFPSQTLSFSGKWTARPAKVAGSRPPPSRKIPFIDIFAPFLRNPLPNCLTGSQAPSHDGFRLPVWIKVPEHVLNFFQYLSFILAFFFSLFFLPPLFRR